MKKTFKRLTASVFSAAIAASVGMAHIPASYAADDFSVTVNNAANDTATHEYLAYQIFTGNVSEINGTKQLTEIQWGSGVNSTSLLSALKASTKFGSTNPFASCTTAAEVALAVENFSANSAEANAFADIVSANTSETSFNLTNDKLPGGAYYFIKDTIKSAPSSNSQYAYSDHILRAITDIEPDAINAKASVPSLDKKIGTDFASGTKTSTASVGDKVPFVLKSSVPDMTSYNDYYFIINDTLGTGLTFNDDVAITVGSYTLTKGTDFDVITSNVAPYTFRIMFKDFYEHLYQNDTPDNHDDDNQHVGEDIIVKYTATLNEQADLTASGNPNKADLTFSNNPNHEYKGGDKPTSDEETDKDVMGKTPESNTKTFSTGISLKKIDATTKAVLEGAKFQITGEGVKAVIINNEIFKEDTTGTYYMLKDGTFTETASTSATADKYDSTTKKYKKITSVTKDTAPASESVNQTGYTGSNGIISFLGLKDGTYTVKELEAPDGYNKLNENITIVISAALDENAQTCTWTAKKGSDNISYKNNVFTFDVENNKGLTLPSTGGVGTTLFYVIGGLLVAGALVLLVVKKRMSISEK